MAEAPVVVVGAGLAGLACARELALRRIPVRVLEREDAVGGRVRTDEVDGFLLDRGFQVFLTAYPEARRVLDYDALALRRLYPGALIFRGGKLHRLADPWRKPVDAAMTLVNPIGTVADKARFFEWRHKVMASSIEEIFSRPQKRSEDYLKDRGFSDPFINAFMKPFFGGVFQERALDTSSRMLEFMLRMFAEGEAAVPAEGMQRIPEQLAEQLPDGTIQLATEVARLWEGGVELVGGEVVPARAVVVATDGTRACELLNDAIPSPIWRGTNCLYFATSEPPVKGAFLVLDADRDGPLNQMIVMSEVSPAYAPPGQALVSATIIGMERGLGQVRTVMEQLSRWFGRSVESWRHLRTYDISEGLPWMNTEFMEQPQKSVRVRDGLYVCGDHREHGSIQGALSSGHRAAEAVWMDLVRPRYEIPQLQHP
ncbi:MAG: NAD(P)/FAD-dependent oxidoreductase [Myxococcaceae bacterium]